VIAVNVKEGDTVKAGDVLLQLDTTLIEAQRAQAMASVAVAQAALGTAQAALGPANAAVKAAQAQYDQLKNGARPEQIAAAEAQVKAATSIVGQAAAQRDQVAEGVTADKLAAAEAQLAQAQARQKQAQTTYDRIQEHIKYLAGPIEEQARFELNAANQAVAAAQAAVDQMRAGADPHTLQAYRNAVGVAVYQGDAAKAQLALLKAGATKEQLDGAQAQVDGAQAQIGVVRAQIKAAQAQVEAAQAAVAILDAQIKKLTLTAPIDGVVFSRAIEPGEVAGPGATLLTIGHLDDLGVTVYVPEDRYGNIRLGQTAQVTVDSFPGRTFTASVLQIADHAEFTPRNSQTVEGRKDTVFAVRLSIANPDLDLKPGMPADVTFGQK
jgi:multidrug resistance efflux pump